MLELTIKILGIIFLTEIILLGILGLIEAVLPRIRRIVIKLREVLLEIKRTIKEVRRRKSK